MSEQATQSLQNSGYPVANISVWSDVIHLGHEEFQSRHGVSIGEAISTIEAYCDAVVGSGHFLASRVFYSYFNHGSFAVDVVHVARDLGGTALYVFFTMTMNEQDKRHYAQTGRLLPPFHFRDVPTAADFDRELVGHPCGGNVKDFHSLAY